MVKLDVWEQILELKKRAAEINHELNKINRFLSNPFENKSITSEKRKKMWENSAKKKQALESEARNIKRELSLMGDQIVPHHEKKKTVGKKK
jgi:hypothetical protein